MVYHSVATNCLYCHVSGLAKKMRTRAKSDTSVMLLLQNKQRLVSATPFWAGGKWVHAMVIWYLFSIRLTLECVCVLSAILDGQMEQWLEIQESHMQIELCVRHKPLKGFYFVFPCFQYFWECGHLNRCEYLIRLSANKFLMCIIFKCILAV